MPIVSTIIDELLTSENIVSLSRSGYEAITPNLSTFYIINEEKTLSDYLGPVALYGTNPILNFNDGAHAQLDQVGNTVISITNVPDGHTFSIYIKTSSLSSYTLALSSIDNLRLIAASSSSLLNPEEYEPNSHFIISGTRRGSVILYLTTVYNAEPVPTTQDNLSAFTINFNGLNQPRVPNIPVWIGADTTLLQWYVNGSVNVTQNNINPYVDSLTDMDAISASITATNLDNSATLYSNVITFSAGAPSGGLLNDLAVWFEGGDTTSKIGSSVISPTFGSIIAGPAGFTNAWDCDNNLSFIDGSNTAYQRANLAAWTIAAVVRPDDINTHYITQSHISILLMASGAVRVLSNGLLETSAGIYTGGEWISIVVSHAADNTTTLWVDGVNMATGSIPVTVEPWYQVGGFVGLDILQFVIADRAWDADDVAIYHNAGNFKPFSTL